MYSYRTCFVFFFIYPFIEKKKIQKIHFSISCVVHKVTENSEKCPNSQSPRLHIVSFVRLT